MIPKEQIHLTLVTSSIQNKERPYRQALKGWNFNHKLPWYDEVEIHQRAPDDETRPMFVAKEKARQDAILVAAMCGWIDLIQHGAKKIAQETKDVYLYTDSVQGIMGKAKTHEKPTMDALTWAKTSPEAIAQSGRQVEIVIGLSTIQCTDGRVSDPQVVCVRVQATMKPFTRDDIIAYAQSAEGARTIEETAGGISLANGGRHFYDETKPLTVTLEDEDGTHKEILYRFDQWANVPNETLKPFISGAFEPAVIRVVEKTLGKKVV